MFSSNLQTIWSNILDSVFPVFCISCRSEGSILCNTCMHTLELPGVFCCPVCHRDTADGSVCSQCKIISVLARHRAIMPFSEGSLVHTMIHTYKYQYIESLEKVFEHVIAQFVSRHPLTGFSFLVPVPLHKRRYAERGFNQSERIARILSHYTDIPVANALVRHRYTEKQATLDRAGRLGNVKDACRLDPHYEEEVKDASVLIVDDVYTTGSTISECARVLGLHGAAHVEGFTFARG